MPHEEQSSLGTVARVVRVLAALADSDGSAGVGDLSAQLQLAPSTAHRLLNLLKAEGMVEASPTGGRYGIGPEFYRIAARVVATVDVTALSQPYIETLARRFDETVLFGLYLPHRQALAFTARADGEQALLYRIDMNRPGSLAWGASGKSVLAYLPAGHIRSVLGLEEPSPVAGARQADPAVVESELAEIRERGYAVTEGEKLPEARGIGAPVFGPRGVVGCILLTSPKSRMPHADINVIGAAVREEALRLSHDLGGEPPLCQ